MFKMIDCLSREVGSSNRNSDNQREILKLKNTILCQKEVIEWMCLISKWTWQERICELEGESIEII